MRRSTIVFVLLLFLTLVAGSARDEIATFHPELDAVGAADSDSDDSNLEATSVHGAAASFITYRLPAAGLVSMGIYDANGRLLRTLFSGQTRPSGTNTETWDGLDDAGNRLTANTHTFRGVLNPSSVVTAAYDFSIGNPGKPPYWIPSHKGSWGGVWGSVIDVAGAGGYLYLLWGQEEGQGSLLKLDEHGRVQWKQHLPGLLYQSVNTALATDGRYVFVAVDTSGGRGEYLNVRERRTAIWRVDAASGDYVFYGDRPHFYAGAPYPVSRALIFFDTIRAEGNRLPHSTYEANTRGLAASPGRLYVPLYWENKIQIFDSGTGALVSSITGVEKPLGLEYANGHLYVVSKVRILQLSTDGLERQTLITDALVAPFAITVDGPGDLYVTDLGTSQQVKKFAPTGQLLASYGSPGGRTWQSQTIANTFLFPAGLAIDSRQRMVISEDASPRRVVVLDQRGRVQEEWTGPHYYSGNVTVDEENPEYVYYLGSGGASDNPMRFHVDYENKTWRVDSYSMGALWSSFPYEKHNLCQGTWRPMVRRVAGQKFIVIGGSPCILGLRGASVAPVAALGNILPISLTSGWELNPESPYGFTKYKSREDTFFTWRDRNGNQRAEEGEVTYLNGFPIIISPAGAFADANMNLYIPDSFLAYNNPPRQRAVYYWPLVGLDALGNPLYHASRVKKLLEGQFKGELSVWVADSGEIYAADNETSDTKDPAQPDWGGSISLVRDIKIMKFDAKENLLWKAGRKQQREAQPGEFYKLVSIAGVDRGFVFFVDVNGQERVYTDDGLYVATLLDDPFRGYWTLDYITWWERLQRNIGRSLLGVEHFGAQVFRHPASGVLYLMAGSDAIHFWQVRGLDRIYRFSGRVTPNRLAKS